MTIIFGLLASISVIMLSISIQRKNVIFYSTMISLFSLIQYVSLERWTTVIMTGIALLYALSVPFEKKFPILQSSKIIYIIIALYSGTFLFTNGFHLTIDIIAFLASVSSTILMAVKNPYLSKWIMFFNGLSWTVYQMMTGAYGQLPGEMFFMAGVIVSLVLFHKAKKIIFLFIWFLKFQQLFVKKFFLHKV